MASPTAWNMVEPSSVARAIMRQWGAMMVMAEILSFFVGGQPDKGQAAERGERFSGRMGAGKARFVWRGRGGCGSEKRKNGFKEGERTWNCRGRESWDSG